MSDLRCARAVGAFKYRGGWKTHSWRCARKTYPVLALTVHSDWTTPIAHRRREPSYTRVRRAWPMHGGVKVLFRVRVSRVWAQERD